jgi:hypothetical protein
MSDSEILNQIATIDVNVDSVLTDTGTTIPATLGSPVADLATDIAGVQTDTTAILLDTGTTLPATLGSPVADLATDIAGVQTDTTAILADTIVIGTPAGASIAADLVTIDAVVDTLNAKVGGGYTNTPKLSVDMTTASPINLFTVTGVVEAAVIGVVTATVTSGGVPTAEVGVAGTTALYIAQVADATGLATNEIWHDANPDATAEASTVWVPYISTNGQDIICTIGGAAITGGTIDFYCKWYPISSGASVAAA